MLDNYTNYFVLRVNMFPGKSMKFIEIVAQYLQDDNSC